MAEKNNGNEYDVIIIGSGLGGLTAGALLAKAGKNVIVLERHDRPGGYAQSFTRRGFTFDSSIHFTGGCFPTESRLHGIVYQTLELLNVEDKCTFYKLNPFMRMYAENFSFDFPSGDRNFADALCRMCPEEEIQIRKFHALIRKVDLEIRKFPAILTFWKILTLLFRIPHIIRYGNHTLGQILDHFFRDERIKAVFSSLSLCFAMKPSDASFLQWSQLYASMIDEDGAYCGGTFQRLADVLVEALTTFGGTFRKNTDVAAITVSGKKVTGVSLSNGDCISAPVVVSNADLLHTYEQMLGGAFNDHRFVRRLTKLTPSMSAFTVYIATDLPCETLPVQSESFLFDSLDTGKWTGASDSEFPSHLLVNIPTLMDHTIAPAGTHIVMLTTLIPYRDSFPENEKNAYAQKCIKRTNTLLPGLDNHILFHIAASPKTLERYTRNSRGAIMGWEATPRQIGPQRPSPRSPLIDGLFHVGHWTRPGGGIYGVTISALQVSQQILGFKHSSAFLKFLKQIK